MPIIVQHTGPMLRLSQKGSLGASVALVIAALASGCTPPGPKVPGGAVDQGAAKAYLEAFHSEMTSPEAPDGYLEAIDFAVKHPHDTASLAVVLASVDALLESSGGARGVSPIAYRSRENFQKIALKLRQAWDELDGEDAENAPFMRVALARGLHGMAIFTGEAKGANVWFERRACVPAATVIGPLDTTPLTALEGAAKTPGTGPFPATYTGPNLFNPALVAEVPARGCALDVGGASDKPGLREVVLHVENPKAQRLSVLLTASTTTLVEIGGIKVTERRFDAGWSQLLAMGHAQVEEGTARVVLRLADQGNSYVELSIVGEDGLPVKVSAPKANAEAKAKASAPVEVQLARSSGAEADLVTRAAALLTAGDPRRAEHLLEKALLAKREGHDAAFHLLWIRAMERAGDMTDWKRIELTRASAEELKKLAPGTWESKAIAVDLAQRRKGQSDGTFESLAELGVTKPDADLSKLGLMELALVLDLARQAGMQDLSERAYAAIAQRAPGSPMLAILDTQMHPRSGREWLKVACEGGLSRGDTACAEAKAAVGDRKGALEELARLRVLTSSPRSLLRNEFELRQAMGDDKGALAVFESMLPWERQTQTVLPLLARMPKKEEGKARALRELLKDRSRPYTMAQLGLAFGEPSADAKAFEEEGKKLVEKDKKQLSLPGAATAVLKHVEHYGMDQDGFMTVVIYDLRRVSGTTDVERAMSVEQPMIDGSGMIRPLRRRVHKQDGRILEAEAASFMGGGDLSQLEKGDYVEHFMVGYYIPNALGEITVDTPDLLPERTSIADAEVVLRLPESFKATYWAHSALGKPTETTKDGYKFTTYRLKNQAPRRIEDGLPWLERGARISFGTQTWEKVGRAVGENIRGLEDSDPFIVRFAEEAGKPKDADKGDDQAALVARVVDHVGKTIKIASGGAELSDFSSFSGGAGAGGGQSIRSMVEEGVGSRTWVLYRTLRELGVKVDLAVAETEPFSAAPNFPAHPGRFRKPLVVARLDKGDVWIDADVEGPPLPPGRVSPELRGRSAILSAGAIVPVPVSNDDPVDEVNIELVLGASGTAKGNVSIQLRGRTAQSLSESFNYVVGEDRVNMLRGVVQSWLPWASVDEVKLVSKEGAWEVGLTAQVTIPGFGSIEGKEGKTWIIPGYDPGKSGTLAGMYASKVARESALNIDYPIQYRVKRKTKLPANAKVERLAPAVDQKSPFLSANRSIKVEGDTLVEEFVMNLPTGTVTAESYRAFLDTVQTTDSGFLAGVRVRVKP